VEVDTVSPGGKGDPARIHGVFSFVNVELYIGDLIVDVL
jgi:hypothetical protein